MVVDSAQYAHVDDPAALDEAVRRARSEREDELAAADRAYEAVMDDVDAAASALGDELTNAAARAANTVQPGNPASVVAGARFGLAIAAGDVPAFGLLKPGQTDPVTEDLMRAAPYEYDERFGPFRIDGSGRFKAGNWTDGEAAFESWDNEYGSGVAGRYDAVAEAGMHGEFEHRTSVGSVEYEISGDGLVGGWAESSGGFEMSNGPNGYAESVALSAGVGMGARGEVETSRSGPGYATTTTARPARPGTGPRPPRPASARSDATVSPSRTNTARRSAQGRPGRSRRVSTSGTACSEAAPVSEDRSDSSPGAAQATAERSAWTASPSVSAGISPPSSVSKPT